MLIGYDRKLCSMGVIREIHLDFGKTPHVAVSGATGTGKTMAVKLILGRILSEMPDAQVTVCDFKHDDFRFLDGLKHYYSFLSCSDGLESFFREFQTRQNGECNSRSFRLLVFDEWASYLNTISDKKTIEAEKMKLATLLMLGRSYRFHILVSQQRFDTATSFISGARDQFSFVVALGNISKEAAQMFGFDKDAMIPAHGVGAGHALIHGAEQISIQVPTVQDFCKLDKAILQLISRS